MNDFKPGIIPVPTYLFNDDELLDIIARLEEIDSEIESADIEPAMRASHCIAAIRRELAKRGRPISLRRK